MLEFTEKSLILKVGRFRESDLWVRLFTPTRGIITAFAFGGSRSVRRFCGCLDPFNHVLFRIKGSRRGDYLYLMEGSLLGAWPRLRTDIRRQGLAVNCLKFFEAAHVGPQGSREAYGLVVSTLDVLASDAELSELFPFYFRAKVAFSQGYVPDLSTCSRCGNNISNSVAPHLLVEQGRMLCDACGPRGRGVRLGCEAVTALECIRDGDPAAWSGLEVSPRARRQCFDAVDGFVRYHLGLAWEDGRFKRI